MLFLPKTRKAKAFRLTNCWVLAKASAVSKHLPYGNIGEADTAKLARQIKIVGMLVQTKVYLFCRTELNRKRVS
jgi:hypothetical protein